MYRARAFVSCALLVAGGCGPSYDEALAGGAAATAGAARPDGPQVWLDRSSDGQTVSLAPRQHLNLALRNLGDGGYDPWVVTTVPDPSVLVATRSVHHIGHSGFGGDFGTDIFSFRAVEPGETDLALSATRCWSGEMETVALRITVQPDVSSPP